MLVIAGLWPASHSSARSVSSEINIAGSTTGCFGIDCAPQSGVSLSGLTYSNSTFSGTTFASGFLPLGGNPVPGANVNNLGSFTLSAVPGNYNGNTFRLRVVFTAPQGITGGDSIHLSATLSGSVVGDDMGGVRLDFDNTPAQLTFTDQSGSGSFLFSVNDVSVNAGQTAALTGQVTGAQWTVSPTPTPTPSPTPTPQGTTLESILFQFPQSGTTVQGITNQTGVFFDFTANTVVTTPLAGQARIEDAFGAGNFTELSILCDPSYAFTAALFDVNSVGEGAVTITRIMVNGQQTSGTYALFYGSNLFNLDAVGGQLLREVTISVEGTAIQDVRQIRVSGVQARQTPTPEAGAISFTQPGFSVSEGNESAAIMLTRTGGSDTKVVAKVDITDVTTNPADYRFAPGSLDTSFDPGMGANGDVYATSTQPDGRVVIGGGFTAVNGVARNRVARLNADGSLDTSFNPGAGANSDIKTVVLQPDGKAVVGGDFTSFNGVARSRVARLNSDGSLDSSFNPGAGVNGRVYMVAVQPDGKVVIGGGFTAVNGVARNRVARLNADGSLDTSFNPGAGANNFVITVALQPDGKVVIGGNFTAVNGSARNSVARLDTDGSLDTSFDPGAGPNNIVWASSLKSDGKVVVGGEFTAVNGVARNRVARLNADGSLDTSFNPGAGPSGAVLATAAQPDGKVVIGGNFSAFNGVGRNRITRLEGDLFVTWGAGDSSTKTIYLPIVDDSLTEADETLTLTLSPLTGGATTGAYPTATLTIVDNDQPAGNTPAGTNVSVQPVDSTTGNPAPVTLTFSQVTGDGTTTVTSSPNNGAGQPLPDRFKLGNPPTYYDISTTAQFTPPVTICIQYPDSAYRRNESNLRLMHFNGTAWEDITTSVNVQTNTVCGVTNSLSPFVVAEEDLQPPEFAATGQINATATSSAGAAVNYTAPEATDDFDGPVPVNCSPPSGATFALGTTTVACTAADGAGNTATEHFDVTVTYSWSGVLQPINADGSSVFKLGGTVPVKFQLTGASAGVTDAVARFTYTKVNGTVTGTEVEPTVALAATSGNLFRYDPSSGQHVYNWGTKGLTVGTYRVRIDLGDGVTRTVQVSLK